jgi:vesicle-fusing ATPase
LDKLEPSNQLEPIERKFEDNGYSYHRLRRDLWDLCQSAGVAVGSRYVVPSTHLTVSRFVGQDPFGRGDERGEVEREGWVGTVEEVNASLEGSYWPRDGGARIEEGGKWVVGEEKGLECRRERLWYGGETVRWEGTFEG